MTKRLIISLLIMTASFGAGAQSMNELFIGMPDDIIVHLEDAWRKDLVDLYKTGKRARLENTLQGSSELLKLTDDYLLLQSTSRSVIELKRLPQINNTFIICMITTVYGPVADSRVDFYTTSWQPLTSGDLLKPAVESDFLQAGIDTSSVDYLEVKAASDIFLVKYSLNPDNTDLKAEYTTVQILDDEMRKKTEQFLSNNPKIFTWKQSHYE